MVSDSTNKTTEKSGFKKGAEFLLMGVFLVELVIVSVIFLQTPEVDRDFALGIFLFAAGSLLFFSLPVSYLLGGLMGYCTEKIIHARKISPGSLKRAFWMLYLTMVFILIVCAGLGILYDYLN